VTDDDVIVTLAVLAGTQLCASGPSCNHIARRDDNRADYERMRGYYCHCCKQKTRRSNDDVWESKTPSLRNCDGSPL
jgi:hypothetical protein